MREQKHSEKLTSHFSVKGGTKFVTYAVIGSLVYLLIYFNTGGKLSVDRIQAYQVNGGHVTAANITKEVDVATNAISEDASQAQAAAAPQVDVAELISKSRAEREALCAVAGKTSLVRDGSSKDTQSECEANIVNIEVPARMTNGDTTLKLKCHKNLADALTGAFTEIYNTTTFKFDGGTYCYAYRNISRTTKLSLHSYGMAVDVNPTHNWQYNWWTIGQSAPCTSSCNKSPTNQDDDIHIRTDNHPVVKIFEKYGFGWAPKDYPGSYGYGDIMHFSYLYGE